ncbi:hypothetical protein DFH06DRAFT_282320 [Mycena polygramma]|nr:hypothetical protein DFH06DRAFT_282320 [Mycena polygramma]
MCCAVRNERRFVLFEFGPGQGESSTSTHPDLDSGPAAERRPYVGTCQDTHTADSGTMSLSDQTNKLHGHDVHYAPGSATAVPTEEAAVVRRWTSPSARTDMVLSIGTLVSEPIYRMPGTISRTWTRGGFKIQPLRAKQLRILIPAILQHFKYPLSGSGRASEDDMDGCLEVQICKL